MSAPLRLVSDRPDQSHTDGTPADGTHPAAGDRWPLLRLCAGEALLLGAEEIDLVALVNAASDLDAPLLSPDIDPDDFRLAEVLIEHLCQHHGIDRQAKGDRLQGVESNERRYVLPFLIELDAARPEGRRGVAELRITHLELLSRVLAGSKPLPAATVAADRLRRRGVACVFLSVVDAGHVSHGGATAVATAIADGTVPTHLDVRTGETIIRTADLRTAGLLVERTAPHGLSKDYAKNVLRVLEGAVARAAVLGGRMRGTFKFHPIEPLVHQRLREPKPPVERVELTMIGDLAALLPVLGQVVVWIERLTGSRISEIYGLLVSDYYRDERGRGWLTITKQGGAASLGCNEAGRFQKQDSKPHTKTGAGQRTIPIPRQLAGLLDHLIAVFHSDPQGGTDWNARLIPGVGKDDASGQSTVRSWVGAAQEVLDVAFDFHALRATLITDLRDAGVDDRTAHYYAGHEHPDNSIQSKHYDLGPGRVLLIEVAEILDTMVATELDGEDLRVPTPVREQWGKATRWYPRADQIDAALVGQGWRTNGEVHPGLGRLLSVKQAAGILGYKEPSTRRLMSSGAFAAHQTMWGARPVWVAWESDVRAYRKQLSGPTLHDLAAEFGWEYHQVWNLVHHLGLVPDDHVKGHALRLAPQPAETVRAEMLGRQTNQVSIVLREAADRLELEVGAVEKLIEQGLLNQVTNPHGGRKRHVSVASVETYLLSYPPSPGPADNGAAQEADDVALTGTQTRQLLGLRRTEMETLTSIRQLSTCRKQGSRHPYYSARSALRWAERSGNIGAARRIQEILLR